MFSWLSPALSTHTLKSPSITLSLCSVPACSSSNGLFHLSLPFLTPTLFPSHYSQLHLGHRSSRGHGVAWLAGSCTRPGCTGWSTGPAGGDGPGDSMQPVPRPAEGSPRGSPPPVEPHSLRQSAGLCSRGSSHEGGPVKTTEGHNDTAKGCWWGQCVSVSPLSTSLNLYLVFSNTLIKFIMSVKVHNTWITHFTNAEFFCYVFI